MMKKYYNTNKEGTFIKVETLYNKGGETEWARRRNPRSYQLYISLVEKKNVPGATLETYCPSDSMRLILNEVSRASKKAEAEADKIAETHAQRYVTMFAENRGVQIID